MDTLMIVLGVLLGLVLIFGIYRLATAHLRERPSLKPSSETAPRQTAATIFVILISIALLAALIFAFRYFAAQ